MPLEHSLSRLLALAIALHQTKRKEVVASRQYTNSNVHQL